MHATIPQTSTDLVLDDIVADTVLVVKDLLTGTVSSIHFISFDPSKHQQTALDASQRSSNLA